MDEHIQDLIKKAYAAYNARDIDTALTIMHPDVEWPRALEGDHVIGHDAIRKHWTKQWAELDPHVEPIEIHERPDGSLEVTVHQTIKDLKGSAIVEGIVKHVYAVQEGLLRRMDIEIGPTAHAPAGDGTGRFTKQ